MILCGIPRTGKTTFWKRLAKVKGFRTSDISPSTSAFEAHTISANQKKDAIECSLPHLESAMLFDLHLYEDSEDLRKEALTIYKHIVMTNVAEPVTKDSSPTKPTFPETHLAVAKSPVKAVSGTEKAPSPVSLQAAAAVPKQSDPLSVKIEKCFNDLHLLLKSGKNLPDIPLMKKLCTLADIGGQRAFLEMLPTVTIGKALYLLCFSYENFEKELCETVQMKGDAKEVRTGTMYKQMDVIMQSLICVSTTTKVSSQNVALLVGTHVDKVEPKYVDTVNSIIKEKVKPFLEKETLVYAKKNELVLEVSIHPNRRCSNDPEDYQNVIMTLVENRLKCSDSERLPASWYMFSLLLRKMQLSGHSVLRYHHCVQIANKLHIKEMQLQSLLSRMHKVLGVVIYFPEVEQLKDIVICDPAVVYKGISELIFHSFDERFHPKLCLRFKKWGVFLTSELKQQHKTQKECQLQLDKLLILLQHLGVIAPVDAIECAESDQSVGKPEDEEETDHTVHSQYVIPCMLDDTEEAKLKVVIQEAQMCYIEPLRVFFKCGFAPMGGFCYLLTKLITNYRDKGWQLLLPDIFEETTKNDLYSRNKVTFKVDDKYIVTLLSTHKYFEIHIVICSQSEHIYQLGSEGHSICQKVWNAVSNVLSKSLNAPLQEYETACECIEHRKNDDYDGHHMTFRHDPDDHVAEVTASCSKDKSITMTVNDEMQSMIVWFKVCHCVCMSNQLAFSYLKNMYCFTQDLGQGTMEEG